MYRPFSILPFFAVFAFANSLFAQTGKTDSLIALLPTTKDTVRVNLLNEISKSFWYNDPLKTIAYAEQAAELATGLRYNEGLTSALNNKGVGFYQQNRYTESEYWYNAALTIYRQTGNYRGEANTCSNIGLIYWKQAQLGTAVEFYLRALKIWEDHGDDASAASIFDNLGNVYNDQEDFERALSYYFKALALERKHGLEPHKISMTLSNIGTAYLAQEKYEDALRYFAESLTLLGEEEKESRAVSLSNIGITHTGLKNNDTALQYLMQALLLQEELGDADGMVPTLLGLSKIHEQQNRLKESRQYASRALNIIQTIDDKASLAEAWLMHAQIAQKAGDYKNAYQYYINSVAANDSVRNKANIYKLAHLQAGYETEKKQAEIALLKKERQQQAFRRNAMMAGLAGLLLMAGLVVSRQRLKIRQGRQLMKINRQLVQQSEQLEEQTKKLQELNEAKSVFFANISHEFRTPLTLILNNLHDRIDLAKTSDSTDELVQLEVMHRNARRLLNLINQLLDLSKLEAGQMKLSAGNCDITRLLRVVYASFTSASHSMGINFSLSLPDAPVNAVVDADQVEKMLYNLLSNAFKFTPKGGAVHVSLIVKEEAGRQMIQFCVTDSGQGIGPEQQAQIFNRFYQGKQYYPDKQGTGIGLALTKELAELHDGKIWVESEEGRGSRFIIMLPLIPVTNNEPFSEAAILSKAPVNAGAPVAPVPAGEETGGDHEQPVVLVVEDNEDLRYYIKSHLSKKYRVLETENGVLGLKKATAIIPDLIITDRMMPEMDGIALCHHLKTDERTSHIPVILLTALADKDNKLQGLETGADEYLTKPFDNRELQLRIKNLIESRRQLREKYSRQLQLGPKKIQVSSVDEKFLEKVMQAIEEHMGDPDFSMEKFGQEVALSRMQLHRKLKALTGESPGDFLRTMRLKRARRLLEARAGNVSEIAYEVGFNTLSYFSKCYREQFGISPNETAPSEKNPD